MPLAIEVQGDMGLIDDQKVAKIAARAFRREAKRTRAKGAREVKEELKGAKLKDIRQRVNDKVQTNQAEISFEDFRLPLDLFDPRRIKVSSSRGTRHGVSIRGPKSGKRVRIKGHFRSRAGLPIGRRKGRDRYPLKAAHAPGVALVASDEGFLEDLGQDALDRIEKETQRLLENDVFKDL